MIIRTHVQNYLLETQAKIFTDELIWSLEFALKQQKPGKVGGVLMKQKLGFELILVNVEEWTYEVLPATGYA